MPATRCLQICKRKIILRIINIVKIDRQLMYNICNIGFDMCRSRQNLEALKAIEKGKHPSERAIGVSEQNLTSVPTLDEKLKRYVCSRLS